MEWLHRPATPTTLIEVAIIAAAFAPVFLAFYILSH